MDQLKPKLPQKGGSKKAVEAVNRFRRQVPSERLIKIISEIPDETSDKPKLDIAAKEI